MFDHWRLKNHKRERNFDQEAHFMIVTSIALFQPFGRCLSSADVRGRSTLETLEWNSKFANWNENWISIEMIRNKFENYLQKKAYGFQWYNCRANDCRCTMSVRCHRMCPSDWQCPISDSAKCNDRAWTIFKIEVWNVTKCILIVWSRIKESFFEQPLKLFH